MTFTISSKFAALGLAALTLAACENPDDGYRNTRQNAGVGALVGAATGAIIGGDAKGAAIGGIIGGSAGALYGGYLDKQEAELRGSLNNAQIVNTGDSLVVTMPQDILFATDSATLNPGQTTDLYTVANSLNKYPASRVQVIGHTDNTGAAAYNQQLSERRAQSVAYTLVSGGVSQARITSIGRGEDQPRATNQTAEGRQQNRRVEIVIIPTQGG
ncbi:OmpA family protein [Pseudooceanicola sp.]|jgi:outer membrane protein OmpA-like peptidoglycan-associated protein|uniref:OmpA family protein n=1 Tax=Pseudooceanicola sp. TaxID=1914328 RepID=UPI00405808FA